jgi:hypothetical protein
MDTQLGARHRRSSEMGSIRPDDESTAGAGNSGIGPSSSHKELWLSSVSGDWLAHAEFLLINRCLRVEKQSETMTKSS